LKIELYQEDEYVSTVYPRPKVHVHRPPAVTLNETLEEFQLSTGRWSEDLNQIYCGRSLDMNPKTSEP